MSTLSNVRIEDLVRKCRRQLWFSFYYYGKKTRNTKSSNVFCICSINRISPLHFLTRSYLLMLFDGYVYILFGFKPCQCWAIIRHPRSWQYWPFWWSQNYWNPNLYALKHHHWNRSPVKDLLLVAKSPVYSIPIGISSNEIIVIQNYLLKFSIHRNSATVAGTLVVPCGWYQVPGTPGRLD